jgi:hypothetical protein
MSSGDRLDTSSLVDSSGPGARLDLGRLLSWAVAGIAGAISTSLVSIPVSIGEGAIIGLNTVGQVAELAVLTYLRFSAEIASAAFGASAEGTRQFGPLSFAVAIAVAGVTLWVVQLGVRELVE